MNGKQVKELRGQLRQIVKEELPELITIEFYTVALERVQKNVNERLDELKKQLTDTLKEIEDRNKALQVMVTRMLAGPIQPAQTQGQVQEGQSDEKSASAE